MSCSSILPEANAAALRIDFPSEAEKRQTRLLNFVEWGGALTENDYIAREKYLETIPLARNGGIQGWILTEPESTAGSRRVLASCETWRKRALVTSAETATVVEGIAYGVGSVYTYPQYRGRGYCSRLLKELQIQLQQGTKTKGDKVNSPLAIALWSDIGKGFYARMGWIPYESFHVSFPVSDISRNLETSSTSGEIKYDNLERFATLDENILRRKMTARIKLGQKKLFAFAPDYDTMRWHLFRDEWITRRLFPSSSKVTVNGAYAGTVGSRVWAIWTRNYDQDTTQVQKNSLNIIRLVIENESAPLERLVVAFLEVMKRAERVAKDWDMGQIVLWNPDEITKAMIKAGGLSSDFF